MTRKKKPVKKRRVGKAKSKDREFTIYVNKHSVWKTITIVLAILLLFVIWRNYLI